MGFGLKFPVYQRKWSDILTRGIFINDSCGPLSGASSTSPGISDSDSSSGTLSSLPNIFIADNSEDALPYFDCDFKKSFVLVIGSESAGISEEVRITDCVRVLC
jgi:hypothetical protein